MNQMERNYYNHAVRDEHSYHRIANYNIIIPKIGKTINSGNNNEGGGHLLPQHRQIAIREMISAVKQ